MAIEEPPPPRTGRATAEEPPPPRTGRTAAEPPPPQRGTTAEERGPDTSAAEEKLAAATSWRSRLVAAADPRFLLSQADGYPTGVKQFLQFCLILIYPAWLFVILIAWPIWVIGKGLELILYGLFWPVRARYKKRDPEGYAAYREKLGKAP